MDDRTKGLMGVIGFFVMIGLMAYSFTWFTNWSENLIQEAEIEEQKIQSEYYQYLRDEAWCDDNRNFTYTKYDLLSYYNMTCEEIKFNIDNWVKVYETRKEYIGGGGLFSSGQYQYIQEYNGKGQLNLKMNDYVGIYPKSDRCWATSSSGSNYYKEQDWVNYYSNNCIQENGSFSEVNK